MGILKSVTDVFRSSPTTIDVTPSRDDMDYIEEALRRGFGEDKKQFDWNHYREQNGSDASAWGDEYNIAPTIRILKASYAKDPVVFKAINAIARQFQSPKFQVQRLTDDKGTRQASVRSPMIDLLTNPGFEPPQKFHATNIIELVTAGNLFLWVNPARNKILRLPSERIRLEVKNGAVAKYCLDRAGDRTEDADTDGRKEFTPEEIIHIALPNPFSRHVGLSWIVAQSLPILAQKYTRESVIGFHARGGHNALILKSNISNGEQLIRMFKSIALAFSGRRNQWGDKLLPNGVEVAGTPLKFSEMMIDKILEMSERDILGALGVPPVEVGITDGSNYANAESQRESFYLNCIIPLAKYYSSGLQFSPTGRALGLADKDILEIDFSHIRWLADTDRKLNEAIKMKDSGVVLSNEIRLHVGLPVMARFVDKLPLELAAAAVPSPFSMQNILDPGVTDTGSDMVNVNAETSPTISLNGAQVTAILEIVSQVAQGLLPRETGVSLIETAFALPRETADAIMGTVGAGFVPAAPQVAQASMPTLIQSGLGEPTVTPATPVETLPNVVTEDDQLQSEWKRTEADLQNAPVRIQNTFIGEFSAWEQIITSNLKEEDKARETITARAKAFGVRLAEVNAAPMKRAYDNQYAQIVRRLGKAMTKDNAADREAKLAALRARARQVMEGEIAGIYENRFVGYSDTLMTRAYTIIEEGFASDLSSDAVASNIRKLIGEFYEGQALTITRTEYQSGIAHAQAQFGTDLATVTKSMSKRWLSKIDSFTRTDEDIGAGNGHAELDGVVLTGESKKIMELAFTNGLRYPKDNKGNAASIINCRCTISYEVNEWED